MSAPDPQDLIQWEEAARWLYKAREDIAAARLCLREGLLGTAAFHVQQAVEKATKALLIAARQDVLKTHDIETLATLASRQWPHLVPSPHPLAYLTRWYLASRYPAIDDVAPSAEEVSEALRQSEI